MAEYYKVLRINKGASDAEIRKAYRDMAKRYHPDLNKDPDAKKKFMEANEAYEMLIDRRKRYSYDVRRKARSKMSRSHTRKYAEEPDTAYDDWVASARERANTHSQMPYEKFMNTSFYKRTSMVFSVYFLLILIIGVFLIFYPGYRWVKYDDSDALFAILYLVPIGIGFIIGGLVGMSSK